jgi:hypothetical protein
MLTGRLHLGGSEHYNRADVTEVLCRQHVPTDPFGDLASCLVLQARTV